MKTLLQIVRDFCKISGIPAPQSVSTSSDTQILQLVGILNEGLDELVVKYKWQQLQREATFTSTAIENQGKLDDLAPGFKALIPNTMWSLSKRLPTNGSITPADAQTLKIWGRPSALINFRQVQDELHFIPAGEAGLQYRFEYESDFAVIDGTTGQLKRHFEKDNDLPVLPDSVHSMDLRWRWKSEKGLSYAENFRSFELLCKQAYVDGQTKSNISMSNAGRHAMPGVVVPIGSWQR
jgi:hypothetical protein